MTFEQWADRTFGSDFKEYETLTYFRMSAAWDKAQEYMKDDLERVEKDASRYRYLKNSCVHEDCYGDLTITFRCDFENFREPDAAIDKAISDKS